MIDPANITNYNYTDRDLEELLVFCIMVAGKPAFRTSRNVDKFLKNQDQPLQYIYSLLENNLLLEKLKEYSFGQYKKLIKCFQDLKKHNLNLRTCGVSELENIHGIGPKTARFFLLHSRPKQEIAVLDVHVLRYLREKHNVKTPKSTPSKKQYAKIEKIFLEIAKKQNKSIAEFDLEIWNSGAIKS